MSTSKKSKVSATASSLSSSDRKGLKQGNLFSFFSKTNPGIAKKIETKETLKSKKSKNDSKRSTNSSNPLSQNDNNNKHTASTAGNSPSKRPSTSSNDNQKQCNRKWQKIKVGSRIAVYWKDDGKYYACTVIKQRPARDGRDNSSTNDNKGSCYFHLRYDDGEEEEGVNMAMETFKFVDEDDHLNDEEVDHGVAISSSSSSTSGQKRRRSIRESDHDDDEEQEWQDDDNGDDDESAFEASNDDDEDDDDEDQWLVTDDEDDDEIARTSKKRPKKKAKTSLKVTHHEPSSSNSSLTPPASKKTKTTVNNAAGINNSAFKTPLRQFSHTVSPRTASTQKQPTGTFTNPPSTKTNRTNDFTKVPSLNLSKTLTNSNKNPSADNSPPMFHKSGVVNVKGSHVHNHLKFLQNPRDSQGRSPDHPQYDCRTLKVDEKDWKRVNDSDMTDAVKQWWNLKSQYFDTVLLFKTGKFYEMFHMDADIGVEVLGLSYMKGKDAHAGFPETAYGTMADKLVRAGYKVARVEQTETPEQLKIRKSNTRGKNKPKVLNREVCSIMSLGTRTFCALDSSSALMNEEGSGGNGGCGPLLAICEVLVDDAPQQSSTERNEAVQPVCEYGITIIDAIRGTVTLGMFADDVLRSRMQTLLTTFAPSEILIQGATANNDEAEAGASPTLVSLLKSYQTNSRTPCRIEFIQQQESFPKSTALDPEHRRQLERQRPVIHPWDVQETLDELHRKRYYPRGSRQTGNRSVTRWPPVLQAVVEGEARLCLASFGAALFYLQRNLIDHELLSMGIVKAYIPQSSPGIAQNSSQNSIKFSSTQETIQEQQPSSASISPGHEESLEENPLYQIPVSNSMDGEDHITYMSLDGTTLHNLEILTNSVDFKVSGSLWSKLNHTKSPHGARMLRAWVLRPLFRKADIDRRADAVQQLVGGAGALALKEARQIVLSKIGDLDRLLSRVHSMSIGVASGTGPTEEDGDNAFGDDGVSDYHPSERAVLYECAVYTKRKVGDFSKLLNGLRKACQIPELFADLDLDPTGLLYKLVRLRKDGGLFPDMEEDLDWYFDNFDLDKAAKGLFEPTRGCDPVYDQACDTIHGVKCQLDVYKEEMCKILSPRHVARSSWKYININPDSKDKYLVELPANVEVPDDFYIKGKRGTGQKQINKYRTPVVADMVKELEQALEIQQLRKAKGMQVVFAKFDAERSLWAAAAHATAILDALGSLAIMAESPGYCRAEIIDCPPDKQPSLSIIQGRHPVVEKSFHSSDFIPNDLVMGIQEGQSNDSSRMLLLSGPNMGGKSTMLRQTCLIAILAQIGSYVPAERCHLTPVDCIFTRLGASDRILLGQSTFFVELAETAAALRGATRRSLVIMDELGRGTSTFDGTAIASATVKHLVERSQCISLFATHYHSLLDEWENAANVRLGHMQCVVDENENETSGNSNITFLYTLGPGSCPKSFGINVAKLAGLPEEVLLNAKRVSEEFEEEMNGESLEQNQIIVQISDDDADDRLRKMLHMFESQDEHSLQNMWETIQNKP